MSRAHAIRSREKFAATVDVVHADLRYLMVTTAEAIDRRVDAEHRQLQRLALRLHSLAEGLAEIMGSDDCETAPPPASEDRRAAAEEVVLKNWTLVFQHLEFLRELQTMFQEEDASASLEAMLTEHADILNQRHVVCIRRFIAWLPREIAVYERAARICKHALTRDLAAGSEEHAAVSREWEATQADS